MAEEQGNSYPQRPTPEQDNPFDLLPPWLEAELPSIEMIKEEADPVVHCAYFSPISHWQWFAFSFDRGFGIFRQDIFLGYVLGWEAEAGSFLLEELSSGRDVYEGVMRLVEFPKMRFSELKEQLRAKGFNG